MYPQKDNNKSFDPKNLDKETEQLINLGLFDTEISYPVVPELISVNYHITNRCNYNCEFCFAHFRDSKNLSKDDSLNLLDKLIAAGTKKLTFVGGEPTLVKYLPDLVKYCYDHGVTTMLVTNGTRINNDYLRHFTGKLDWVGLSIDSEIEYVNHKLGRGSGNHVAQTIKNAELLHKCEISLKVNTVVTSLNWNENMNWLIHKLNPDRWKVFQMLPIKHENYNAQNLLILGEQFRIFLETHLENIPVSENNNRMKGSYIMIDPQGRFFDNINGYLRYSREILQVGITEAFRDVFFSLDKFVQRGGKYNWEGK